MWLRTKGDYVNESGKAEDSYDSLVGVDLEDYHLLDALEQWMWFCNTMRFEGNRSTWIIV